MNPNITKLIDQYLSGELNAEDTAIFEARMVSTPELQQEVELQQTIVDGAIRATDRVEVRKAGKKYHYKKLLKWTSLSTIALAIVASTILYITAPKAESGNELPAISSDLISKLDKNAQLENLDIQYFAIAENGGVVLSEDGVLISVPKGAFMLNGKPYEGQVIVQFQEAINGGDIVKSGLSTMSGDRLLETQGMFGLEGFTADGKPLKFNPKVGVYVQTPVDEYKEAMQMFDGVKKADGSIDWQNPKPLAKIPVPVDMSELDFYPKGYEDFLDEQQWKKSKKSRDSLYLSMEEENNNEIARPAYIAAVSEDPKDLVEGQKLYTANCTACHQADENGSGPMLRFVRQKWSDGGAKPNSIYTWVRNFREAMAEDPYAAQVAQWSSAASKQFPNLTNEQIDNIFDYVDSSPYNYNSVSIADSLANSDAASAYPSGSDLPPNLSPSKVLAFWNKKFNNTNLATREFEKRVSVMRYKCFEANSILKKYTSQLNKPMWEIDAEIAAMGHSEFKEFAAEKVGVLDIDNKHLKGLEAFYDKGIAKLKKENSRDQKAEKERQGDWDESVAEDRSKERKRTRNREAKALDQEYNFNLRNVKKHFGKTEGFTVRHGGGVVKNIDAYVYEATVKRETTTIQDPETGKTFEIKYNKFSLEVENSGKYIKMFTYLFPSKIKSYQRINGKGGKFSYTLNDDMVYDIAVVGITEKGYEYFQQMSVKGGDLGMVQLEKLTEADLDASVKQLNGKRTSKPMDISAELDWLVKEREDYKEQKMRQSMAAFRESVKCVIYPCYSCANTAGEYQVAFEPMPEFGLH